MTTAKERRELDYDREEKLYILNDEEMQIVIGVRKRAFIRDNPELISNMRDIASRRAEPFRVGRSKTVRNRGYDHTDFIQ